MNKPFFTTLTGCFCLLLSSQTFAQQSAEQQAMQKLDFLTGSFAGPGKSWDSDGNMSEYWDTEDVWYDVQGAVMIIQAKGFRDDQQFYGLHTVIYYDKTAGHYWYHPYAEDGVARPFECQLEDGPTLRCYVADKSYRLTFQRTEDKRWNEFGERLVDGQWQKSFETVLEAVK